MQGTQDKAKPSKADKEAAWLDNKLAYIRGLKSPSDQLKLLLLLAEKPTRTPDEERAFATIIRAEKAAERAKAAQANATRILKAEAAAERKRRDHELYKVAGLLGLVGLVDKRTGMPLMDLGELTGALAGLVQVPADDPRRTEWKRAGDAILARDEKESRKTAEEVARPLNT